jgi:hypothetical protein
LVDRVAEDFFSSDFCLYKIGRHLMVSPCLGWYRRLLCSFGVGGAAGWRGVARPENRPRDPFCHHAEDEKSGKGGSDHFLNSFRPI